MILIPEVKDTVVVQGTVCGHNADGGTLILSSRKWTVEVVKAWHDEECGWRYWGRFTTDVETQLAIAEGSAGSPECKDDKYLPDQEALGPEICFFSEFDVVGASQI